MPWPCVCLGVCVCVCLSQAGIVSRGLHIGLGSRKQRRMIAQDSSVLVPKIFSKFERGSPLTETPNAGGVGVGRSWRISAMSKTVQERRIVSIKDEWEIMCALSQGDIGDDLG